jgi:hypothetical protein
MIIMQILKSGLLFSQHVNILHQANLVSNEQHVVFLRVTR